MMGNKISLIATVFNEEANIERFLKSILDQSERPNEFIIVDGGSKDKTFEIIEDYSKNNPWIRAFKKDGLNIPKGRNYAIENAKHEIIIGCDAGTEYKRNWLEELVNGFLDSNLDLGFGKTLPLVRNSFQEDLAKRMKQRFGSSRNIIFKKKVWKEVGGYPEELDIAEDTVFNGMIKNKEFKIGNIPNAIGYWEMRSSLEEVKKQFYNYGKWDRIANEKYSLLPKSYRIQIIILSLLSPFYPLLRIISKFSKGLEIDVVRKFAYLKGFKKGK